MTAAQASAPQGAGRTARPQGFSRSAGPRLVRLHLTSRHVPAAVAALAGCAVVLRVALRLHWIQGTGVGAQALPLVIEAGTAVVVATTTRSVIGEPERATGRWLPWLRLGTGLALTGAAVGALAAGSAGADLPGGTLDLLRNVAGLAGVGLASATVLGANLAWIASTAYLAVAEYAVGASWQTPWMWPGRPPHDAGAALCAGLVFAVGAAAVTARGARDEARE